MDLKVQRNQSFRILPKIKVFLYYKITALLSMSNQYDKENNNLES